MARRLDTVEVKTVAFRYGTVKLDPGGTIVSGLPIGLTFKVPRNASKNRLSDLAMWIDTQVRPLL